MTNRQLVIDALSDLPETASMEDILETVRFLAGVLKALEESERGEGIPIEDVERQIKLWAK